MRFKVVWKDNEGKAVVEAFDSLTEAEIRKAVLVKQGYSVAVVGMR